MNQKRNAKTKAPTPIRLSSPKTNPMENCPRTFSPQVFLNREPECFMETNTPLFSNIMTGITKKVRKLRYHAQKTYKNHSYELAYRTEPFAVFNSVDNHAQD